MSQHDDHLAYGHYNPQQDMARGGGGGTSTRGLVGDTFKKLKDSYKSHQSQQPGQNQPYGYSHGPSTGSQSSYQQQQYQYGQQTHQNPAYHGTPSKDDKVSGLLGKLQGRVVDIGSDVAQRLGTAIDPHAYAEYGQVKPDENQPFPCFAPARQGNDVKWYVDGCGYFYAVSKALEVAHESIWILGAWVSPELYLRRPPTKNEQYRLDRMLQAAAQRGVGVNVIVQDEPSSSSTELLQDLHPNIAVLRYADNSGSWAQNEKLCLIDGRMAFLGGFDLAFGNWDTNQQALSDVHPANPAETVFPGPDYKNSRVLTGDASQGPNQLDRSFAPRMGWSDVGMCVHGQVVDDLRRHFVERWNFIYGAKYESRNDPRYSRLALYGRPISSTSQHSQYKPPQSPQPGHQPQYQPPQSPQPGQPQPGQSQYEQHSSQQQAQSPQPPAYQHPQYQPSHSPQPGQQQYQQQYQQPGQQPQGQQTSPYQAYPGPQPSQSPNPGYHTPSYSPNPAQTQVTPQGTPQTQTPQYTYTGQSFPPPPPGPPPNLSNKPNQSEPYFPPPPSQETQTREVEGCEGTREGDMDRGIPLPRRFKKDDLTQYGNVLRGQLAGQIHQYQDRLTSYGRPQARGNMSCQIVRSCGPWSHGSDKEHSIADAYAAIIRSSEHFIYIENESFITATGDTQKPVQNQIGTAIVERILRAARAGKKYKVIVVIPCLPNVTGDLGDPSAARARAIMEAQYNSINRGGNSIMELIAKEGYNPMDYIRFYNLRTYDRINMGSVVAAELDSTPALDYAPGSRSAFDPTTPYQQAQKTSTSSSGRWDSVSECHMLNGEDIRKVPWEGPSEAEIDAFVTEELHVHSKIMIADDRIVICGSASISDKSLVGDQDSEVAMLIEDYTPILSVMDNKTYTASRFAASLRRELFRKHLGLLPAQDPQGVTANSEPVGVPNTFFDTETPESRLVADPLADTFTSLWNSRAKTNTEVFRKVFHVVPDDSVRDWGTYKEFHAYLFHDMETHRGVVPARYRYGHAVGDDFPSGPEGVKQVKELLSQVKGSLVEMPLMFLIQEF